MIPSIDPIVLSNKLHPPSQLPLSNKTAPSHSNNVPKAKKLIVYIILIS